MFLDFLYALRSQGLVVGLGEWLLFLRALSKGMATDVDGMYHLGRSLLCRSETEFDGYDLAFAGVFEGAVLPDDLREKLVDWLSGALSGEPGDWVDHGLSEDELWKQFMERLKEQKERHDGGNHWIGTGGTSPFGHSGRGARGIRVGGSGGGRQAVNVATERRWENYRTDRVLDVRQTQVALRALRNLARQGDWILDLPDTIRETCRNAGDIEIVHERERKNQVHVVLLMDAGGSMAPHFERVSNLFSAANRLKTFKSFQAYSFHNCVYGWLYRDIDRLDRVRTDRVLEDLTAKHRLLFVGDASMAPYELFSAHGWPAEEAIAGLDWLRRFRQRCPGSVWLNPDPTRYWRHPTVTAIGDVFPMFELTLDGIRDAVKKLRAPV
jgi:uncharacterized protein